MQPEERAEPHTGGAADKASLSLGHVPRRISPPLKYKSSSQ